MYKQWYRSSLMLCHRAIQVTYEYRKSKLNNLVECTMYQHFQEID